MEIIDALRVYRKYIIFRYRRNTQLHFYRLVYLLLQIPFLIATEHKSIEAEKITENNIFLATFLLIKLNVK